MSSVRNGFSGRIRALLQNRRAASTTEYAILLGLIALVAISAVASVGQSAGRQFKTIAKVAHAIPQPIRTHHDVRKDAARQTANTLRVERSRDQDTKLRPASR